VISIEFLIARVRTQRPCSTGLALHDRGRVF
jgi:hypothetical protein